MRSVLEVSKSPHNQSSDRKSPYNKSSDQQVFPLYNLRSLILLYRLRLPMVVIAQQSMIIYDCVIIHLYQSSILRSPNQTDLLNHHWVGSKIKRSNSLSDCLIYSVRNSSGIVRIASRTPINGDRIFPEEVNKGRSIICVDFEKDEFRTRPYRRLSNDIVNCPGSTTEIQALVIRIDPAKQNFLFLLDEALLLIVCHIITW
jgi:hypothetical protein